MLIRTACFVAYRTCIVYLLWPLKKGMHLKVKMVQASKVKLSGHGGHDFRHILALLRT